MQPTKQTNNQRMNQLRGDRCIEVYQLGSDDLQASKPKISGKEVSCQAELGKSGEHVKKTMPAELGNPTKTFSLGKRFARATPFWRGVLTEKSPVRSPGEEMVSKLARNKIKRCGASYRNLSARERLNLKPWFSSKNSPFEPCRRNSFASYFWLGI